MKPTKCRICGQPHTRTIAGDTAGERWPALRCDACVARVNPERARRERVARAEGYCPHTVDLVDQLEVSAADGGRVAA